MSKLDWEVLEEIKVGSVKAEIQGSAGARGMKYSVSVKKCFTTKEGEERASIHLWPRDLVAAVEALQEAVRWIECDRVERSQQHQRGQRRE